MPKYKEFIFTAYNFDYSTGELTLQYSLDHKVDFEEKVFWDVSEIDFTKIDKNLLENALADLHLIAGISYYKTYRPAELKVENMALSEKQTKFWEKIYKLGLGEFFYKNQIDFRKLVKFKSVESKNLKIQDSQKDIAQESNKEILRFKSETLNQQKSIKIPLRGQGGVDLWGNNTHQPPSREANRKKCLVPIGGGKDSLVTAELLKKGGFDFTLYSLGDSVPQKETAELVGKPRFTVRRELSPNLFELNKQGAFNGHVPISAYIAFLSLVTSILYGYDYIVLSNEHSANYGNLDYLGIKINHQYSKSLEFERDFNNYVHENMTKEIKYFSLLRPFYELKIAKIFSQYPQYFSAFTSCNTNFKILKETPWRGQGRVKPQSKKHQPTNLKGGFKGKWCCHCPKCAFVFAILAPFIPKTKIVEIFGKNLFAEEKLQNLFLELLGAQKNKPFECVGTAEEVAVAFYLISEKKEWKNDFMIKIFVQKILPQIENIEALKKKVFGIYLEESLLPEEFKKFF